MLTRACSQIRASEALHEFKVSLDKVKTEDVTRLINHIRGNGYSKNCQNDIIKALKRFFLW